ncbi:MAG: type II and III secretion system protein family protein [Rhizobiaceae bacterium]|nr:type II and III secretion system protein family protein [Rhizobiaceae bacterium]
MGNIRFLIAATLARIMVFALVFAWFAGLLAPAHANDVVTVSANSNATIKVAKGKPRTVRTSVPFYEIVIGDPEIANVNPLTDRSFYVLGNELGTTGIALFDENKQLVGTLDIEVTLDTDRLASTIREAVPGNNIRVGSANGRVVLSGEATDSQAAQKARDIAERFSGDEQVINSVNITSSQQVQLNVRFVEINRQVGQELGTQLNAQYAFGGNTVGLNTNPQSSSNAPAGAVIAGLTWGGLTIDLALRALEDRGVARRLAEPNLIARSGETASFLAGGEFPIPVANTENTITIEYKKYGVSLEFTPTVLADGLISLDIRPEVSSVDTSASYQVGNLAIPGFVVRRAHTMVDLKSGQSFMIAGLLQSQNDTGTQRLPGIGKLPILGNLFSSKAYQRRETDLVIIITPYLVKPIDPSKQVRTPMDDTKAPGAVDYFLGNRDELRVSQLNGQSGQPVRPERGYGHYLDLN